MTARPSSSLALAVGAGAVDAELGGVVVLRPPAGVLLRGERLPLRQAFDGILLQPVDSWGQPRNFVRSQKILEYEISLAIELIDLFLAQSHHSQKQLRARKFASRRSSRSTAAVGPSATIVDRRGGRQQPAGLNLGFAHQDCGYGAGIRPRVRTIQLYAMQRASTRSSTIF